MFYFIYYRHPIAYWYTYAYWYTLKLAKKKKPRNITKKTEIERN